MLTTLVLLTKILLLSYAVCIRPEQGFCCVMYSLCPDQPEADAFSLDNEATAADVMNDDNCLTFDHITIPESGKRSSPICRYPLPTKMRTLVFSVVSS